ncbi:DUF724 domain-containing protein [Actinidia chinensis var. chinensis]|uniref:DUF724 domain-containing protein n=1 Tax=Actinidia chinensis var. chinensis TaxID=1590841 RepID=A0A2R6QZH2_ACTCC|nr:DUF724 domain-containing protein [Actinidia chinensis var. chinensis]
MRFKRGTKVEVMNNKDVFVSWQRAEIISGNGHTYDVTFNCYPGSNGEVMVERIPGKAIRPCPPPVDALGHWVAGDIVEVLDNVSWKIATVLKVLDRDHYLVRVLGVTQEFRVHKSNTRVRQSWQENKWVVIGKASGSCDDRKSNKMPTSKCYQKTRVQMLQANTKSKLQEGDDRFAVRDNAVLLESHLVSSRTLKRASPYCSSLLDAYAGNVQKIRAIDKEGRRQRFVPAPLQEKVDAVAYPREILGEKYMHSSSNNRSNGCNEMEREKLSGLVRCSLARNPESNDSDSDACSVGSCSINGDSLNKFPSHFVAGPCQDVDTLSCDEESFFGSGNQENCHFPPGEEVAASIHRLELRAYQCTLEALYASGPLSWEQEAMLTNLRITLHISNDEHLTELRNLICAGTGIHIT